MVKFSCFACVISVYGMLSALPGLAEVASQAQSAEAWATAWKAEAAQAGQPAGSQRMAVVRRMKNGIKVVTLDKEAAKALPMVQPDQEEVELALEINRPVPVTSPEKQNPCLANSVALAQCVNASVILELAGSKWRLVRLNPAGTGLVKVAEGSAADKDNPEKWLAAELGFDGVILAVKDGVYLAAITNKNSGKEFQALAIKNSEKLSQLPKSKDTSGSALLASVSTWEGFATFKIITGDQLPIGTKLVIEGQRSKK